MLGIIVLLILSWLILRIAKNDLKVLGLKPNAFRLKTFVSGFIVSAIVCIIYFSWNIIALEAKININENYSAGNFLNGFWWTFRSVLFEEFLFRGALLFLAIKYIGKTKACILSAMIFGVYHWFSYGVLGSVTPMIHVFIITSAGGLMFAYAYAETRSLYFPIGLHLGWNLATITIFSEGPIGDQLLITTSENNLSTGMYFVFVIYQISVLPLFTYFYLKKINPIKYLAVAS